MKTIEEMISIMQAYAEGKKIEFRNIDNKKNIWYDANTLCWNWGDFDYRIKPEPKYRPYKDANECFDDIRKHGSWVKNKVGEYINILGIGDNYLSHVGNSFFSYEKAYNYWVWADDGSVFGVKEEE